MIDVVVIILVFLMLLFQDNLLVLIVLITIGLLIIFKPGETSYIARVKSIMRNTDDISRPSLYINPFYYPISKSDIIKPFYSEENLRKTMTRLNIDISTPITDHTAPIIASHLANFGYTF